MAREVNVTGVPTRFRIGLALSGGGFRASIFHLGVIRRLEELGIMAEVDVISAVSGGSIIGAYYVCEMERRLRALDPTQWRVPATRVQVFEAIADEFLRAVDHNLRTRALVFTPFSYPIRFLTTLWRKARRDGGRSELIQREYDKWFFDGETLDQLPSVAPDGGGVRAGLLTGPRVVLNTTSLLTGERVAFTREPNSGILEMKRSNRNSLPLSLVVGASSGVPVLFPPTYILGDLLVDGGVADNQGLEALLDPPVPTDAVQIILVSDASGQLEAVHRMSTRALSVFARVNDILQFQVRRKLVDALIRWRQSGPPNGRAFAFLHLFLNIKDRGTADRLPSEMIPATARLRTDLDQFSYIERETLMYHGYTLIDAQIRQYCEPLATYRPDQVPLTCPPLFTPQAIAQADHRDRVRTDLEAGANKVFLWRSLLKYPTAVAPAMVMWAAAWIGALHTLFVRFPDVVLGAQEWIGKALAGVTSAWYVRAVLDRLLQWAALPPREALIDGVAKLLGTIGLAALAGYLLAYPTYLVIRRIVRRADERTYTRLTGTRPTLHWTERGDDGQEEGHATRR